ncbi:c-type cytochrome [Lentibacillus sp. N15]|uniref:c-type cytochrome n=1 Tax=Lentibacillus songyuanensis TaxID=3136161 RepID=UPI0031BBC21B
MGTLKVNSLIFVIGFIFALGIGYFAFSGTDSSTASDAKTATSNESTAEDSSTDEEESDASTETAKEASVPAEAEPLSTNNCLSCHAVESLGAEGGTTGPDLSNIYKEVKGKRGKDLDTFLQDPTSAVMSTVIGDNPLSDEERAQIVEALKAASEK